MSPESDTPRGIDTKEFFTQPHEPLNIAGEIILWEMASRCRSPKHLVLAASNSSVAVHSLRLEKKHIAPRFAKCRNSSF